MTSDILFCFTPVINADLDHLMAAIFQYWTFLFYSIMQCDGQRILLPSLQGIAVLNIPSYAGGTNFWGGTKEDDVSTTLRANDGI